VRLRPGRIARGDGERGTVGVQGVPVLSQAVPAHELQRRVERLQAARRLHGIAAHAR
jgi:hypothetical protein